MPDPDPDPLSDKVVYVAWRTEKLKEIKEVIGDGINLLDLPQLVDVPLITLRGWVIRYLQVEVSHQKTIVKGVCFANSGLITSGRVLAARASRLSLIKRILVDNGPVSLKRLAQITFIPYSTLWQWSKKRLMTRDSKLPLQKKTILVIGVIE